MYEHVDELRCATVSKMYTDMVGDCQEFDEEIHAIVASFQDQGIEDSLSALVRD